MAVVKEQERPDWFLVSGARALRGASSVSYRDYVRRSANFSTPTFEDDKRQIDLDLPRTGTSICEFILHMPVPTGEDDNDDGGGDDEIPSELLAPYLPVLRNILLAYSMRNPRVGYVQGHADVVCFLIGNINERQDEEEVFWVYASIIERLGLPGRLLRENAKAPRLPSGNASDSWWSHYVEYQTNTSYCLALPVGQQAFQGAGDPETRSTHARARPVHCANGSSFPSIQMDLTLVTSLLSCKWFVSVWVGQLPVDLLRKVWDVMLGEEEDGGGAILHLLLGLHFFQTAIDSVMIHMATEDWDSSYLYKIIMEKSHVVTELDPHELLRQGHMMYGLNDEAIEDMRSTLRLDQQIRRPEFVELARVTKFNLAELEQLHEEFTFVRFHTKAYERMKLRGVRQEYFESLVSREFTTWPVDICARLFQAMKPDGYGNVSFSSLTQLLSVLTRGEPEDKAALLFQIPDMLERGYLDRDGIDQLADLLCCLFANKTLADTSPHPLRGVERDAFLRNNTEQSPLLRSHFRKKLEPLAAENEKLGWDAWWEHVQMDNEILALMEWSGCDRHIQSDNQHRQHSYRKKSVHSQPNHSPSGVTLLSPIDRDLLHARNGKNRRHSDSSSDLTATATTVWTRSSKKKPNSSESIKESDDRLRVSLLSKQMKKKFKISRALIAGDALRRNPFEAQFPGSGNASGMSNHSQLYWCQCTIN